MDKDALRKEWKRRLSSLSEEKRNEWLHQMYDKLFSHEYWTSSQIIGVTVSIGNEIDTRPIIEQAWKEGKVVAIPKCNPINKSLSFYQFNDDDQLESHYFGLKEPNPDLCEKIHVSDMDLLLVPGLVFDHSGYRVGHGGGYYDRFLSKENDLLTAALCFEMQLVENLPHERHDIPVGVIITSDKWIESRKKSENNRFQ
ncbi:5-formyltetrahydrofolate cyclo-ligase [Salipaludibacillus keqinensis]|uniref:5-formyltetrahydrofolate cyclo-ligase n=1 Tax=Salipaludibacillus keqinensis TaxID=2045207 RepID=A0A323TID4_9BACI|nr:5-formyltetrahydrofolate cyclo-ligase [Salipaludibacillus keqinensis]PYZ94300.1 5-formyltetrahydrofolate cyclo-ligase [Salipaludibacillus keqinensis]